MNAELEVQSRIDRQRCSTLAVTLLMNLWCYPLMALWTLFGLLIFPLAYGFFRLLLRWPPDRLTRWFIWLYGRGWLVLMRPFMPFCRQQMHLIEAHRPCLFVVNHLSFFDTYCMALLPVFDIAFAVRSWPFRMFWYSTFMRLARYLDVEGGTWENNLDSSRLTFARGGSVLFFPEGHRSRDGELQRFYSGGFKVAISAGVPVVPLCINGTGQLLPPGRRLLRPAAVTLRALAPIETRGYTDEEGHIRLRKLVKQRMALALAEMRGEA